MEMEHEVYDPAATSGMDHVASVSVNKDDGRFNFNDDFFKIV